MYDIYAKTDVRSRITDIRADWNGNDVPDMTLIGQQTTAYAQDIYCPNGLYEEHMIPLYKLANGTVIERTQAEIGMDITAIPATAPTEAELLQAQIDDILVALVEV